MKRTITEHEKLGSFRIIALAVAIILIGCMSLWLYIALEDAPLLLIPAGVGMIFVAREMYSDLRRLW